MTYAISAGFFILDNVKSPEIIALRVQRGGRGERQTKKYVETVRVLRRGTILSQTGFCLNSITQYGKVWTGLGSSANPFARLPIVFPVPTRAQH